MRCRARSSSLFFIVVAEYFFFASSFYYYVSLGVVKLSVYINVYQNERIHLKSIFASLFLP